MIVYDLEMFNTDRAVLCCKSDYKLSKISGKFNKDMTSSQSQKCLEDCIVFRLVNCVNQFLDHASKEKSNG